MIGTVEKAENLATWGRVILTTQRDGNSAGALEGMRFLENAGNGLLSAGVQEDTGFGFDIFQGSRDRDALRV